MNLIPFEICEYQKNISGIQGRDQKPQNTRNFLGSGRQKCDEC